MNQTTDILVLLLAALLGAAAGYLLARTRAALAVADANSRANAAAERVTAAQTQSSLARNELGTMVADNERAREQLAARDRSLAQLEHELGARDTAIQDQLVNLERTKATLEAVTQASGTKDATIAGLQGEISQMRIAKAEVDATREQFERQAAQLQQLFDDKIGLTLAKLGEELLDKSSARLVNDLTATSKPLAAGLDALDRLLREQQDKQVAAEAGMNEKLKLLTEATAVVHSDSRSLLTALRKPKVRGDWGEQHLRQTIELLGLIEHCDFHEQVHLASEDGIKRPDVVVHLAGGRNIAIDAKAPMEAFFDAGDREDPGQQREDYARHARHLRTHIDMLASRAYQDALEGSPEFTVLYLPWEGMLACALDADPELLVYALSKRVLLCSPSVLAGLLHAVAAVWAQAERIENLQQIADLGRDIYDRLCVMSQHAAKHGRALEGAISSYNEMIGSLQNRVYPAARKLRDYKVSSSKEIKTAPQIDTRARLHDAPDLAAPPEIEP